MFTPPSFKEENPETLLKIMQEILLHRTVEMNKYDLDNTFLELSQLVFSEMALKLH